MDIFISMLRGINVSGQKKIIMADLKQLFEDMGFNKVQTYIQSGNVIYLTQEKNTILVSQRIYEAIKLKYGFEVPVITLTNKELKDAALNNPYSATVEIEKLAIAFLANVPGLDRTQAIDKEKYLPDTFFIEGRNLYLHIESGFGRTKLSNNFFESKLKVVATTRNMKTVNKLIELSNAYNLD